MIEPEAVTASAIEGADVPVTVTVRHGGFDTASYALMVGVYADEEMSGAERFLDRQFAELLSGWRDIGRYSGAVGTSVFAEPGRDVAEGCEPVGAHLVGLGSTLSLSRQQVAFAVRSALVDRCLRLYTQAIDQRSDPTVVGVSSALLGVRNDDGLRIEDAVTGILEGVRDANRLLARFERERSLRSRVRVAFVEFVERYADRANLTAAAVRTAGPVAGLPTNFGGLESVSVTPGDAAQGALPAGSAFLESDRTWRRFVISEQKATGRSSSVDTADHSLVVDVSLLGRDARADRVTHRIDRASLDALMARVSRDRSDVAALRALRDRLVPNSMRAQFLTTSAIHLIVDAATANYPWELLAASALSVPEQHAATGTGAVLRMFSETDSRRVQPDRARVGTALIIGAGKVEGFPMLPGVIQEAAEVAAVLESRHIETTTLVDSEGPLDVAELNIALYGDHQILHIASHGVHVDDNADATGAILTRDLRFTADVAGALPTVPELVFLNCCNNGRIGLNRLAAGLARELMALGVRAVVAAAWPVSDAAAMTFARVFYKQLTAGRALGDSVTQARTACAAVGGSATWAAYQCYGDPTFVLRGRSAEVAAVGQPVSRSDLQARLGTLLTQIADLTQPKYGALRDRRVRLLESRAQLGEWADKMGYGKSAEVCRLLAQTARELGDFGEAANRYGLFATDRKSGPRGLARNDSSARDLQQAANCLARRAQEFARVALGTGDLVALANALAEFPRAVALAKGAIDVLPDSEGQSILAGIYKKWATVDKQQRTQHLKKAMAMYGRLRSGQRGGFGVDNRVQVAAVLDPALARHLMPELPKLPRVARTPGSTIIIDAAPARKADYWARAAPGDRALTRLMVATTNEDRAVCKADAIRHYIVACRSRSTFSERSSSVDHLRDLQDLLADDDERKPFLTDAWQELKPWSLLDPVQKAPPGTAREPDAPPTADVPARGSALVNLTALPAACGDCLVLDYVGNDGQPRRVLIDGGLGSAFDRGLGSLLGAAGTPTKVDVAVVTHVDLDHIEGTIRALRDGRLVADDIWFNGREQLEQLFNPGGSRGVRQGDALSELIPNGCRNVAAGGSAFVVPAEGAPPTIALPGGATATLLSPTEERLRRLLRKWPEPERGDDDYGSFDQLIGALVDDVERGAGESFGKDTSVANGSSIAFLFEYDGASILFSADAYASDLEVSIRALLTQRGATKLHVRLFKLPHHGSRQNITDDLLDLIVPDEILVCTDGSKFKHPDEDALDKIRAHYPTAAIHFTDDTELIRSRAARVRSVTPTSSSPVAITL